MNILLFAQLRQVAGCSQIQLATPPSLSADEFWQLLIQQFPNLAPWQQVTRIAVNDQYLLADERIHADDQVALIPPVSGG